MQIRFIFAALLLLFCANIPAQERAEVELETTEGNIRIALFNETPQHRDNFMKLVRMTIPSRPSSGCLRYSIAEAWWPLHGSQTR